MTDIHHATQEAIRFVEVELDSEEGLDNMPELKARLGPVIKYILAVHAQRVRAVVSVYCACGCDGSVLFMPCLP